MKKWIALLSASALLCGCANNSTDTTSTTPSGEVAQTTTTAVVKDDLDTQVVIAGGGMAGLLAALSAADEGADVVLVEKQNYLGGSLLSASAAFMTVESEFTSEYDDSLEAVVDYYHLLNDDSKHQPDYDFLTTILESNGEAIDYMVSDLQLPATAGEGNFARVSFEGRGSGLVENLETCLAERDTITVLMNTSATEIVMEDGNATGLKVNDEQGEYTIHADKVIICTGGANWDEERMLKYVPQLATVDLYEKANRGNTGDGFKMIEAAGGSIVDDLIVKASAPDFTPKLGFTNATKPGVADVLVVDADGNRFTNESPAASTMLTPVMIEHESPAYYAIFDATTTNEDYTSVFDEYISENDPKLVVYGETIEELAQHLSMDVDTLQSTFDTYQAMCADGVDSEFGKSADHLIPYSEEGGYYAAYLMPASYGTVGGCDTDVNGHVLTADGQIIPNLFAAGEMSTYKLLGGEYVGAASLGLYATTGRIAAKTAVSELN